jgi:hypothetical protein
MEKSYRNELLPMGALLLLGSVAFVRLMALPAFEDEGFQLHWIRRFFEAGEWLQPLTDGKPLEVWPMLPLRRLGLEPSLFLIRVLHVLIGAIGAVLVYRLAQRSLTRGAAFACGVLFGICPFVVYLQRLALSDIMMCVAGVAVLLSVMRLLEIPTWNRAAVLAVGLVVVALCKIPVGFWFLTAAPLALLFMPAVQRQPLLQPATAMKLLAAHVPAGLLALAMVSVAAVRWHEGRLPGFGLQEIMTIGLGSQEDIATVIGVARPNLIGELTAQLSVPVVIIALAGLVAAVLLGAWQCRWLVASGVLPMLAIGLLARFWYSRYLLFTLPPLIIASVSGWQGLARRAGRLREPLEVAVLLLTAGLLVQQSARLILDPPAASWSPLDRFQYFDGWGSGYGYPQAARFMLRASDPPEVVYSLDGHSADQLLSYLPAAWRGRVRQIVYADDGHELLSDQARLQNLLDHTPAWIIIAEPLLDRYLDASFGRQNLDRVKLRPIAMFEKPGARMRLAIYQATRP